MKLRDTPYATELKRTVLKLPNGHEARLERLRIKSSNTEEIRFSWWKKNKIVPRPLDMPESAFVTLIVQGIRDGVLTGGR